MREFKNFLFCFLAPQKQACDACLAELVKKEFYAEIILGIGKKNCDTRKAKNKSIEGMGSGFRTICYVLFVQQKNNNDGKR